MAGDSPPEAVSAFLTPIAEALSCFAHGRLSADMWQPRGKGDYGVMTYNDSQSFPLGRNGAVRMGLIMHYEIVESDDEQRGPWKVSTTGWIYQLRYGQDQSFEYHWHPISTSHSLQPHLHIDGAKTHTPTGRVLIEDVLDQAVELGADCLKPGLWHDRRARNREGFDRGATWGTRKQVPGDGDEMPRLR